MKIGHLSAFVALPPVHVSRVSVLDGMRGLWAGFQHYRDLRAAAAELHALDDRMLADIGVERHEIDSAVRGRRNNGDHSKPSRSK